MLAFGNPILAGNVLVRPAIQSPNYDPVNHVGWAIRQDGTFDLNGGTFHGVINIGGATYIYNGAPGAGTLLESLGVLPATTFDPTGLNAVLPGDTQYGFTIGHTLATALQVTAGQVAMYTGPNTQAGPYTQVAQVVFSSAGSINIGPQVIATGGTAASPSLITTDVWHAIPPGSFAAGFAAGGIAPRYLLTTSGEVVLEGQVSLTAAAVAGAVMFTLPYAFSSTRQFATAGTLSGYTAGHVSVQVAANGQVSVQVTGSNGNVVSLDGCSGWTV